MLDWGLPPELSRFGVIDFNPLVVLPPAFLDHECRCIDVNSYAVVPR